MSLQSAKSGLRPGTLCLLILMLLTTSALAQGVSVAPSRIMLDGRTRSATVFVSNRSNEAQTYRVSLSYWLMEEDGTLVRADSLASEADDWAGHVLRYSPRRVVIPAGGSQTLRLLVRRPPGRDVENSEFRAHLSVRSVPTVPRLQEVEDEPLDERERDTLVARLQASVETLVPVVVRFGRPEARIALAEVQVRDADHGRQQLSFKIEREGERSVYGWLVVKHFAPSGVETNIYAGRYVAVYAKNPHRIFRVTPDLEDSVDLTQGRLTISYEEVPEGGGDQSLFHEFHAGQLSLR